MNKSKLLDFKQYQKYFSPQAVKDFDRFLDNLPQNAGKMTLIAAGAIWAIAAIGVLFAVTEVNKLSTITAEKISVEALTPKLPKIAEKPVDNKVLETYINDIKDGYAKLAITAQRSGEVNVTAPTTASYTEFRRFIDHLQYGAENWRVDIKKLCIGRECQGNKIQATLVVSEVRIEG